MPWSCVLFICAVVVFTWLFSFELELELGGTPTMSEFVKGTWELGAGIGTGAGETEETGCSSWLVGVEAIIIKDQQQKLLTCPGYA